MQNKTKKKHITLFISVVNLQMSATVFVGMEWQEVATCHLSLFYVKGGGKDKKNGLFKQWDLHSVPLC